MAKLLEIKGDNPFKIRAYFNAAETVESLPEDIVLAYKENRLIQIKGIGKDLVSKISEIIKEGDFKEHRQLKKQLPEGVVEMLDIPGLGPKTVKLIYEKLGIKDIDTLEKAALSGRLRQAGRIKEKTEKNILNGIELIKEGRNRRLLYYALDIAKDIVEYLKKKGGVKKIEIAGSLRRRRKSVKDIDILVYGGGAVMEHFVNYPQAKEVIARGRTKASILLKNNMQADLRLVEANEFGSALLYFTGSKKFNISLRTLARRKGFKINEYGLFKDKGKEEERVAGKTEKEIFSRLGLIYIPPVLRENRGELQAAENNTLPKLVQEKDIRGDLHIHSNYSDGANSLEELAFAGKEKGYEYLGICDHSQSLKVASGLTEEKLKEKIKKIKALNKRIKGIRLLCGTEVDILSDGSLDYPLDLLKQLDLVVAAVHTGMKQSKEQITKRIVSAVKSGAVHIIAHPTGVLTGVRQGYDVDLEEVIKAAKDYNVALEINSYPQRLDLDDINCRKAKNSGVLLAIGSDSHKLGHLDYLQLGVWTGQRGWLEKENVLNTFPLPDLLKWLKLKR